MRIPDCTLVTALFDLSKFNKSVRTPEKALKGIDSILKLPVYLIVFANHEMMEVIRQRRTDYCYDSMTLFVSMPYEELWSAQFTNLVKENRAKYWPTQDERTCAESHLLCANKFDFVLRAMEMNPFQTSTYAWVDSNLHVDDNTNKICFRYTTSSIPRVMTQVSKDKFHIQVMGVVDKKYKEIENKREYYEVYRWLVSGCFFTCGVDVGKKILKRLKDVVKKTTLSGYGHGEEMFYLEVLDEFYDDIKRSYGDYGQILNNFIHISNNFHYVYSTILLPMLDYGYYREAYDCAAEMIYSVENHLLDEEMDYGLYIATLRCQYEAAINVKPEASEAIVKKMRHTASINKSFEGAMGGYIV